MNNKQWFDQLHTLVSDLKSGTKYGRADASATAIINQIQFYLDNPEGYSDTIVERATTPTDSERVQS